jgi:hypothetical protein
MVCKAAKISPKVAPIGSAFRSKYLEAPLPSRKIRNSERKVQLSQKPLAVTTQYARGRVSDTLRQHWKSRFPACNVRRRNEAVVTDTIFSDTPAVDSGVKAAQLFIGRSLLVAEVYAVETDKEFVNTLEDDIRKQGAMDKLISNCARAETSNCMKDNLRALVISDWQSEPYH